MFWLAVAVESGVQAIALASIDCGAGTGDSCQQDLDGTGFRLKSAASPPGRPGAKTSWLVNPKNAQDEPFHVPP